MKAGRLIAALYARILSRQPSATGLREIVRLVPDESDQAAMQKFYSGVAWALVNSNEFISNH